MNAKINTTTITTPNGEKIVWTAEILGFPMYCRPRVEIFRNGEPWGMFNVSLSEVAEAVSYCTPSNKRRKSIAKKLIAA